ncbi:MAG TPA: hypothetical protein VM582_07310 [Candidatus Thermoplasmatota archaeon]|nr:hypothetical protein [Candidatus Thermoplasmatota archaeon]
MRNHPILTVLLVAAFLSLATGAALAQAPSNPGSQRDAAGDRAAAMAEMRAARNASLAAFHENRSAALADYREAINATRASFLENKTVVIDGCRAARNESADDDNSAFAKCVSDGLKPLIEKARAEHQAAREALAERLLAAREEAKAGFAAARADIRARHARAS